MSRKVVRKVLRSDATEFRYVQGGLPTTTSKPPCLIGQNLYEDYGIKRSLTSPSRSWIDPVETTRGEPASAREPCAATLYSV